ncbi:MAG: response regulator [Pseudanabaenaceae cyanobacterium bins.39]|nr:response regulator [Pseudanabaenaceae cyanobacterium bins.39]
MQANDLDVPRLTVIVVDDDSQIRHELTSALVEQGYVVKNTGDISEALLCVRLYNPDLMLVSFDLPQNSGQDICRILKADAETEHIPIIFMGRGDDALIKVSAFDIGGDDYISKPLQMQELLARIRLHLKVERLQKYLEHKNHELSQALFERVSILHDLQRTNLLLYAQKEAAIDGIFAVDEQGRIASFNRRFCEMWHIPQDIFTNTLEDGATENVLLSSCLSKPELPEVLTGLLESTYDEPDVIRRGEIAYGDRIFDYYTSPVSSNQNKFFGLIWCFRDITAQKQAEARQSQLMEDLRKAKDEAEEAVRSKAAFLAMMSHEIRTPINGVIGMTQLLAGTDVSPEQAKYIRTIQVSGEILLSVVNDILDFSKIESGRLELEQDSLDLRTLVRDVYDVQLPKAKEKKLKFEVSMHGNVPPFVIGDVTRLRQILLNLVSNAMKFTDTGSVKINVRLASLEQPPVVGVPFQLLFAVTDTGIGISEEQMLKLFQPFAQATASTSRKYGGTGLGLLICKRLVESMGGEIRADSEFGHGSTFSFTISTQVADHPPKQGAEDRHMFKPETPERLGDRLPLKILIAEDNLINQELAMAMLIKMGYQPDVVDNGLAVLEAVQMHQYDLLLLDVQMPEMDGLETADYLVNHWQDLETGYERPTIIAMTASAMQGDREMCLRAGMDDYISKPIMMDALHRTLEKWATNSTIDVNVEVSDRHSPASQTSVIDQAAIKNLEQINPKLIARMVHLFTDEEAPVLLRQLKEAISKGDLSDVSYNAHTLKGSSNILGAKALGALCLEAELKGKRGDPTNLEEIFTQIEQQYQIACQELSQILSLR